MNLTFQGQFFLTLKTETKGGRGSNIKYAPYAFTEQGVYMLMTVLKGELATKQSKSLVRLFKKMKDYVIENQEILNHRDFLRFSLQTAENAKNIVEFRQKLLCYLSMQNKTFLSRFSQTTRTMGFTKLSSMIFVKNILD